MMFSVWGETPPLIEEYRGFQKYIDGFERE
jgi:hypothetical protein